MKHLESSLTEAEAETSATEAPVIAGLTVSQYTDSLRSGIQQSFEPTDSVVSPHDGTTWTTDPSGSKRGKNGTKKGGRSHKESDGKREKRQRRQGDSNTGSKRVPKYYE